MVNKDGSQGFTGKELYQIGDRIHELCKDKGVKMKDLSERLNLSKEQLSNITNGRCKRIDPHHICIIADALGTTADYLLTGRRLLIDRPERLSRIDEKLTDEESKRAVAILKLVFNNKEL